jgi:pimeloyl-ACP methyl ester carboxylesterase
MKRSILAAFSALLLAGGAAAQSAKSVDIVLVHGALIDGSSWRGVRNVLVRDGYRVTIVQPPLTGLEDDVAATRRIIDQSNETVVLVGNSYAGSVITVAGSDPKVKALVYVAALQPDAGETSAQAAPPKPESGAHLRVSKDGFVTLDPAHFGADFCPELPKAQLNFMANAQMPIAGSAFETKLPVAAWHDKPSFAVIATEDRALDMQRAKWMAQRAGSKITFVKACHGVHVSQPHAVARVIESAALSVVRPHASDSSRLRP